MASQDEHNLRVYRIDQTTGLLTALGDPQPVGNRPTFVGVLLLPGRYDPFGSWGAPLTRRADAPTSPRGGER